MAVAVLLPAAAAQASVGGTPPTQLARHTVQGSANTAGASLMVSDGFGVNIALLPESSAFLPNVPADARVVAAWLFWSGSETAAGLDNAIRLETPGGGTFLNLRTNACQPGESPCNLTQNRCVEARTPTINVDFFYCRRDVTSLLATLPPGQLGGTYTVGDVTADPGRTVVGVPGACAPGDPNCQAKYGGWSIVVVWESPSSVVVRDAVLWDGFLFADEDFGQPGGGSGISNTFNITGFTAGAGARAELSMFALEGDRQLGTPPQNVPGNPLFCTTCADFLEIRTPSHPAAFRVTDGTMLNAPGNLFNSSNKGGGDSVGVDVDSFNVGVGGVEAVINTGDSNMQFVLGSGDGAPGGDNGGGELFFLGYLFIALDTDAPRLMNPGTFKSPSLTMAAPGDSITYTIRVTNDGAAAASNVRVADTLPPGTTYVSSSTSVCGTPVPDVGGTSPLFQPGGVNVGTLPNTGPNRFCEVRFQVQINTTTGPGTITNTATISADALMSFPVTAATTIVAPQITRFEKTVTGAPGGNVFPGDTVTYTLTVFGNASSSVFGANVVDVLSTNLAGGSVTSRPPGSTLISDANTGRVEVGNITLPAGGTAVITFTATVPAASLDGTTIPNQAILTYPGGSLASDNPSTPAARDPTVITVRNRIALGTSTKTVVAPTSLVAGPGTVVRWRIRAVNSGNRPATVTVADDLPAFVSGCALQSGPAGVGCQPGGANGTGRVAGTFTLGAGATQDIEFTATVVVTAPDGSSLVNRSTLTPAEAPPNAVTLTAPAITVINRPILTTSSKVFSDLNGTPTRPNDVVRYTVTVTNSGNRAATNVVVTDTLPGTLAVVSVGQGGTNTAGTLRWTSATTAALASVAPGGSVTLTADVRVNAGVANGTVVSNTAAISSAEVSPPFVTPAASFTVTAGPVLTLSKTVADTTPAPFRPGDTVRYTLTLNNSGDGVSNATAISDAVPANMTFVTASPGGTLAGTTVSWNVGNLAAAATSVVTFDARINAPLDNGTVISNQGSVRSTQVTTPVLSDDPGVGGAADPTVFSVTSAAVLTLQKTVTDLNGGDTLPGEEVRYSLTVANNGDAIARNTTLTDAVDPRLTAIVPEGGGAVTGQTVTFSAPAVAALAALAPGNTATVTFRARVVSPLGDGTVIPNQGRATSGAVTTLSDDPGTPAANDPTNITIRSVPVLLITKAVSNLTVPGGPFVPGNQIAYDLVIRNAGTENATNVVVTDTLPAQLTSINVGAGGTLTGQTARYDAGSLPALGNLAPGAVQPLRITATIALPLDNGTVVQNQASAVANTLTPVLSDDPATAAANDPTAFTVASSVVLVAQKTVTDLNGGAFRPGDNVRYTVNVTNNGTMNARDMVITDPVDARLQNVVPANGGVVGGGGITWAKAGLPALATVSPGQTVQVTFTAQILSPLDDGTLIANQARANGTGFAQVLTDDPTTPAANDPTQLRVTSAADLSVSTKEILNSAGVRITSATPGQPIRYRIIVRNAGTAVARNVTVTDILPAAWTNTVLDSGGVLAGQTATWTIAQVAPGNTVELNILGNLITPLDNGTVIGNQAQLVVGGAGAPFVTDDPATATPSDQTRVSVTSAPNLSTATKTFSADMGLPVEPGQTVTYTLTVPNTGTAIARNVSVTDVVSGNLTVQTVGNGGTLAGNTITWNVSAIAPGTPAVLTFRARVNNNVASGTLVQNQGRANVAGQPQVLTDDPATPAVDDPTGFTVVAQPHLAITKDLPVGAPRIVAPEDQVTYVITVVNTGSAVATGTQIRDEIPFGVDFVSASNGGVFNGATRTITWSAGNIASFGGQVVLSAVVRVDDLNPDGALLSNQAFGRAANAPVEVASDDPTTPAPLDATVVQVTATVDLTDFRKSSADDNGGALLPSDTLTYTLVVRNTGTAVTRNVAVTDAVPAALQIVTVGQGGTTTGNLITWSNATTPALARLRPSDGPLTLTFTARVRPGTANGTVLSNQATVRSVEVPAGERSDDPATPAVNDPTINVVTAPVLGFDKAFEDQNGPPTIPGDLITYRLAIRNTGGAAATNMLVTDEIPALLQDVVLSLGGTLSGQTATWNLARLEPTETLTFSIIGRIDPNAIGNETVSNRAALSSVELPGPLLSDDPATPANDATVFVMMARPDFTASTLRFEDDPVTIRPGEPLRAVLTLSNTGTAVARGVTAIMVPDGSLTDVVVEDAGGLTGGIATWDATGIPALALMRPGETVVVHLRATVLSPLADGTTISQTARVRATNAAETVVGPATVRVISRARFNTSTLEVTDINSGEVEPGDLLTWRFTVLNDGTATGRNVTAQLPIPTATRYVQTSTTLRGAPVADLSGESTLMAGMNLGDVAAGQAVVVAFQTRVQSDAPRGLRVRGQGWVNEDVAGAAPSDDPRTPELLGDPTEVVVGGGAIVHAQLVAVPQVTLADGTTTLRLVLENAGSLPASDVLIQVPAAAGTAFLPGTLTLGGVPLTDAADGDQGGIELGGWYLRLDTLESGQAAVATVRTRLVVGIERAEFQGTVTRPDAPQTRTDSSAAQPGDQTTVVVRSSAPAEVTGSVEVADVNGGDAQPGDVLQYTVTLSNRGALPATLRLPDGIRAVADTDQLLDETTVSPNPPFAGLPEANVVQLAPEATAPPLDPGQTLVVRFRTNINPDARVDAEVTLTASAVLIDGTTVPLGGTLMRVGSLPGTARLRGRVWQDTDGADGLLNPERDAVFAGWQVLLVAADAGPRATPIRSALTDNSGLYTMSSVAPGSYLARVVSPGGAQFVQVPVLSLRPDERRGQDLRVDPSGVIYDSTSGAPLAGVRVTLFADNADDNPNNDLPVRADLLPNGQQDQVTGTDGRYRFDPFPGRYRVGLGGPQPSSVWPSGALPPGNDDQSANLLGSFARTDAQGRVVPQPLPDMRSPPLYYLRFDLPDANHPVLNNHIPIDPLLRHVRLLKQANKRVVNVGDIITYTLQLTNNGPQDMTVARMGGIELADAMPPGFSLLKGSARMDRINHDAAGRLRREILPTSEPSGKGVLVFGAYDLYAGSQLELRYQMVVGPSVPFGRSVNRALARTADGQVVVSNEASAGVEIRPETLFDDGTVLGKVFCDRNQDGWQDGDEDGALGVRVVLDTGFYAETDEFGRFHFTSVPPGTHLVKIDERTLPPGGALTTPLRQLFYVTRGLPSRFSFGVTCPTQRVDTPQVTINKDAYPEDYVPPPPPDAGPPPPDMVRVGGVVQTRLVQLAGVRQEAVRADLGVTFGVQDPLIGQGPGPNLMAFDAQRGLLLPLVFHMRAKTSLPVAGWRLVVEDEASHEVNHVAEGEGDVPATLEWDGRDPVTSTLRLAAGHAYIATLAVVATNADMGVSAPRRFGIAVGAPAAAPGVEVRTDEARGALFDRRHKGTPRLRSWLKDQAPKLGDPKDAKVRIEVHGDDRTTPLDTPKHKRRARWIADQLKSLGFDPALMEFHTPGGTEPRMPNMGRAQRARNRRVVLSTKGRNPLGEPLAPVESPRRVIINGTEYKPDEHGSFETDVGVYVGELISLDVTTAKGQRITMTRTYTGQPFPEGAPPPPGRAALDVHGDLGAGRLSLAEEAVAVDLSAPVMAEPAGDPNAAYLLDDSSVPDRAVSLKLNAPPQTVKWRVQFYSVPAPSAPQPPPSPADGGVPAQADADDGMGADAGPAAPVAGADGGVVMTLPRVFGAQDVLVYQLSGEGPPPPTVKWSGTNDTGALVLRPGLLRYRFTAELADGTQVSTPDGLLGFTSRPQPVVLGNPFGKGGNLNLASRIAVVGLANNWKAVGGRLTVYAHSHTGKPRMKALLETQQQADAIKHAFMKAGVPEEALDAVGKGFQEPAMAGNSRKARAANQRIEIIFQPPSLAGVMLPPLPPAAEINGQPVAVSGTAFGGHTFTTRAGTVVVAWRDLDGRRVVITHTPVVPVEQQTPATVATVLGPKPTSTLVPVPTGFVMPGALPLPADAAEGFAAWKPAAADGGMAPLPRAATGLSYWAPGGIALALVTPARHPAPAPAPDAVVAPPRRPLPYGPDVLAANLLLDMPPDGAIVGTDRLLVRGMTHPLNRVMVNGQEAVVDMATGRFVHIVRLTEGANTLRVEAEDVRGNIGLITRTYTLDTTGFFFLGFVDTAAAAGARLDEFGQYTAISPVWSPAGGFSLTGGPLTFYGRGVAYMRSRHKGFWRIPFIETVLHLDTARFNNPVQEQDLLGQLNYYPTFGDKAVQVQDARARYPLYVKVKAGENEMYVGNATTQLGYGDLFRYSRARYAGMLTVDQGYVKLRELGGVDLGHTRAKVMMAAGDTPRRPAHLEMRGTGGSLYFLKDRYVVEGTERVYLVVRDAITGQELTRKQLTRNTDYTIRYIEGRLWLNTPLSATADSSFITNNNPTAITNGNPAFLVVDYEHASDSDFSEFGAGGALEQVFLDHVAVGGGYVFEGRRNQQPNYQLMGVHARAFWDQDNYVQAEWAYSRSVNADNAISQDGGLSWQTMGQPVNAGPAVQNGIIYPSEQQGMAYGVKGQLALGKLLLHRNPLDLSAKAYFQRVQSGFFTDATLLGQGQWKYGGEGHWQFSRRDSVRLRWDGMWSEVPQFTQVPEYRLAHRELAVAQLKHVEGPFTLTGEYALSYTEDSGGFGRVDLANFRRRVMNVVAGQVDFRLHKNLSLFARQEGVLTADRALLPRWNDRLTTSLGANVALTDRVELTATESVRWNGENATAVGIKTHVTEDTDLYAQQRLQFRGGNWFNTSVLGASTTNTEASRTYAEVQHDYGSFGEQSRGVMGASHQWTLMEGVHLSMGYERTQVLGTSTTNPGLGPPTSTANGQPTPNAFSDSYAYSQPGAVGSASPWLGSGSRDAMFAQMEFNYFKWLRIQSRLEVRYDNQDERRGGNDRLMFFTQNNLTWNWTEDLSFVGRFNLADIQNKTLNLQEAALQELAAGLAYRPIHNEWFTVLAMLRHRLELRPIMLAQGRFERTTSDVASIEPVLELPFGMQLAEKVAFKWSREKVDDLKEGNAFMALWINRLNYHAFRLVKKYVPFLNRFGGDIDLALEYRLRALITQNQLDHGVVTEVGIVPVPYVRIGLGFNFSRISDDVFAKTNQNAFGPYVRMQAQY